MSTTYGSTFHGLRRPARCEYVRSRPEAARLARGADEDTRSKAKPEKKEKNITKAGCKAPEELPPQTEKLVDFSSARQFRSGAQTAIEKAILEIHP